jgi:hypothetical protein
MFMNYGRNLLIHKHEVAYRRNKQSFQVLDERGKYKANTCEIRTKGN